MTDQRHYDHRLAWTVVAHNVGSPCTMCGTSWPGYVATGYVAIDAETGSVMEDMSIG